MNMIAPVVEPAELKKYSGLQRAGALMLALGKTHGAPIWEQLTLEEITELSSCISQLGRVPVAVVEHLLVQFSGEVTGMTSLHGSYDTTERLLSGILPDDRVREIMAFLKNEYPQTVAVIVQKLRPDHAARVLAELPQEMSADVILRMLRMDTVQKDVIQEVEQTLRSEFMSNLARANRTDPHETIAEIFNALDRTSEEQMMAALDERAPESAERIRSLMFTFEDLGKLLPPAVQTLVRNANKRELTLALKGASEDIRQLFLSSMTERAAKLVRSDMASMGPVRARDCDEAQANLVRLAKTLSDRGEIMLFDSKSDDAMIY
jgi:flagellar motor switch protein FliG